MNEWMNEMKWHDMKWNEMEWNDMKWNEMKEWMKKRMKWVNEWNEWVNDITWHGKESTIERNESHEWMNESLRMNEINWWNEMIEMKWLKWNALINDRLHWLIDIKWNKTKFAPVCKHAWINALTWRGMAVEHIFSLTSRFWWRDRTTPWGFAEYSKWVTEGTTAT